MLIIKLFKRDICISVGKKFIVPTIFFLNLSNRPERFVLGVKKVTCLEMFGVRLECILPCTELQPIIKREPRKIEEKSK